MLSDIDDLIGSLDVLIAKKRDLKQAAMQQLLTGGSRLPGFENLWEIRSIGEVATVDPENLSARTDCDYRFKYISLEDVDTGRLTGYSELSFRFAPSRARRKIVAGDILVATVRPNLKSHLHFQQESPDWICSTGFAVVRCNRDRCDPDFLFQHMFGHSVHSQIERLIAGSNYPAISSNDVRALDIPMPDVREQKAIAAVLSDIEEEIAALESQRDKGRAIKQGMMQDLLTGRIRLT
jgi:type I restriction enzyme S subunit